MAEYGRGKKGLGVVGFHAKKFRENGMALIRQSDSPDDNTLIPYSSIRGGGAQRNAKKNLLVKIGNLMFSKIVVFSKYR